MIAKILHIHVAHCYVVEKTLRLAWKTRVFFFKIGVFLDQVARLPEIFC